MLSKASLRGWLFLFFILLPFFSCNGNRSTVDENSKVKVVSTTSIIHDIVLNIAGDLVDAKSLMGPGIDPHLYKASAGDVATLANANVIFFNGLHLEGKMTDVFENMRKRGVITVAVSERIDKSLLISPKGYEGNYDPHVWFDIIPWKQAVLAVRDTLIGVDPSNSDVYRKNTEVYLKKLDDLHKYVLSRVSTIPSNKRVLITAHDAFNYFGRRYGFEVIGLQGISTATEASTADIQKISSIIIERKIPAIFLESSVSPRYVEAVKEAVRSKGFEVKLGGLLYSDALGDPDTPQGTYIGMFRYNVDTIVNALGGR